MTSDTNSHEDPLHRVVFAPLKPKRRCKIDEPVAPRPEKPKEKSHSPVLLNARAEFRRQHPRITRSGRPQMHFHRVTPPSQLMETMPKRPAPLLSRVTDKVKTARPASHHWQQGIQGIWAALRQLALAFR